ncbi:MAG: LptF/LptG family permease [Saprospiraceae bacterium]|nr:LptF/LptG family permease [Saprospiraceae bacterium]
MLSTFDKYLLKQFMVPFIGAFIISMFVLMMQFLWLYIDDMIGKGLSIWVILELLSYLLVTLFQWSCALAVLIASVMVFGGLAETYELSSMKSAGVSLLRIMRPLLIFVSLLVLLSIFIGGYVVPKAQLKVKSRLYDIRTSKATLNLEKQVFNSDFRGYSIRINDKSEDGRTIYGVMMYRQNGDNQTQMQLIQAEKGEMYFTKDKKVFVMKLYNGTQTEELASPQGALFPAPLIRSNFSVYKKIFDLSEFDINKTDEKLFQSQLIVMTVFEINNSLDSLNRHNAALQKNIISDVHRTTDGVFKQFIPPFVPPRDSVSIIRNKASLKANAVQENSLRERLNAAYSKAAKTGVDSANLIGEDYTRDTTKSIANNMVQIMSREEFHNIINEALFKTQDIKGRAEFLLNSTVNIKKNIVEQRMEFHKKFTFSVITLVFLLIGAPMGSFVRKGGFGYPLLVAIIYFMIFIILTMTFQELGELGHVNEVVAAWAPVLILLPVGLFLLSLSQKDIGFKDYMKHLLPFLYK